MKWLFVYAHPDDEVVAAGGTIRRLVDAGYEVEVILATRGQAGKVLERAKMNLVKLGSVAALREMETKNAAAILGIEMVHFLDFIDGQITNELAWGRLTDVLAEKIKEVEPDVVVTFDHSGWYYHLDHVGVSVATVRAMDRLGMKSYLLTNVFRPPGTERKWPYAYEPLLYDFRVDIAEVLQQKAAAIEAHESQEIGFLEKLKQGKMNEEYFRLVRGDRRGFVATCGEIFWEVLV